MSFVGIGEVMKNSGCCPLVNPYHPRHPRKADVAAEPLVTFERGSMVRLVPCTMNLRQGVRRHEALLYGNSTLVKRQEELGLMTMIVKDRALKPLPLTCRGISCTDIFLKE